MSEKYNHTIVDGETEHFLSSGNMPIKLQRGGLFFCQAGETDIVIDMKHYTVSKDHLVVAFPFTIIQHLKSSKDFKGFVLDIDSDFFGNFSMSGRSSYYLNIKENPCIKVTDIEREKIFSLYNMLMEMNKKTEHPFRSEIDDNIIQIISYEVAAIYHLRKPIVEQACSRNEEIFQRFIFSLFNNYNTQRSIDYYAKEQSISARHLSLVVKLVSGVTAGQWIINCVIIHIKTRLKNKKILISEISDEFNFPNASFFSQYFRKYTGLTPKMFRERM